jgi:protein required for attachment to host cells
MKCFLPLLLLVVGCVYAPPHVVDQFNFERLFMHVVRTFSVLVADGDKLKLYRIDPYDSEPPITFIQDVPEGKSMWFKGERGNHYYYNMEFHIHSVQDINGANWNHGKQGRGQTHVIE